MHHVLDGRHEGGVDGHAGGSLHLLRGPLSHRLAGVRSRVLRGLLRGVECRAGSRWKQLLPAVRLLLPMSLQLLPPLPLIAGHGIGVWHHFTHGHRLGERSDIARATVV